MSNSLIYQCIVLLSVCLTFADCNWNENAIDESAERSGLRCISGQDCQQTECSVMGMQRFSEPQCEPLGGLGAPCRVGAEADNKTLHFPHMTMECENVYMQFCPCAKGLVCDEAECRKPAKRPPRYGSRYNTWSTRMRMMHY